MTDINSVVRRYIAATDEGPKPLPEMSVEAPQLPPEILPGSWREWICDIAERLQCPPDYPAIAAIVGAAALVGNRIRMRPKVHDPWLVVPNLWGAIVGVPGVMKTPAVNEGLLFFREIAEQQRQDFEVRKKDAEFEREFAEARKSELSKLMRKGDVDKRGLREQFDQLAVEEPKETRLWTTDVTVEKLGELLNENPHGILLSRDELTGWFRVLDRAGHEQDRAFYLETWNGEGSFTFDRIARGKTHIENLTLSILGTIQPAMIGPYIAGSLDGGSDDGLVQRFQLLVHPEPPKSYRYIDRRPLGRQEARESFRALHKIKPEDVDARNLPDEDGGHAFLQFDQTAQEFFQDWLTKLEGHLRSDSFETSALESHLAKYRSLMPSLALIFHLLDRTTGKSINTSVGLLHANMAAEWCLYLQGHAKKLYAMAMLSEFDVAREILRRIETNQIGNTFTARDVYLNHWKKLNKPEQVKGGLEVLVEHGYLTAVELEQPGRRKIVYIVREPRVSKVAKPPFDTFDTTVNANIPEKIATVSDKAKNGHLDSVRYLGGRPLVKCGFCGHLKYVDAACPLCRVMT